ncbi:YmaF family protein [Clostridium sp. SHJSY1]|uniref:YmaF family protein n=1 Tax=Clostridium sp. SHJSY1 TaxID=2942483 RepID=UPI0028740917|nr:YmaF family protein [Clostridium sp. SHJSY1]MDS0525016.1 YmaF family protein [Clostridium sp. SHJSY1]
MGHKEQDCYLIEDHNHEFLSSTNYAQDDERTVHNHRIAGVTGPAIKYGKSHVHKVSVLTDTFGDHFHNINDTTGPAIYLPGGKHIHLLAGRTSVDDGHFHVYYFATLIQNPSEVPEAKTC